MTVTEPANLSVGWSSVLLVRHASLKCSGIEHTSDYSRTHERELVDRRNAHDSHPRSRAAYQRCAPAGQRAGRQPAPLRTRRACPDAPARPGEAGGRADALLRHRCRDVGRPAPQAAGHARRRRWGWPWLAGVITLWLGLVAILGQMANGDPATRLVRSRAGQSCRRAGRTGGVPSGSRCPSRARRTGSPGRPNASANSTTCLANAGRGPDADRTGRLTAHGPRAAKAPRRQGPWFPRR